MGAKKEMNIGDFAYFMADIFVDQVQYGNRTGLCSLMKSIEDKNLEGKLTAIIENYNPNSADYERDNLKNITITDSPMRQWTYQFCTEFGWF